MSKAPLGALTALLLWACTLSVASPVSAQSETTADTVACEVMGHDLILYNRGAVALAAGTVVHWSAWMGRREGDHTLEVPLEPLVGLQLSGALGASYLWDRPCRATIVSTTAN